MSISDTAILLARRLIFSVFGKIGFKSSMVFNLSLCLHPKQKRKIKILLRKYGNKKKTGKCENVLKLEQWERADHKI